MKNTYSNIIKTRTGMFLFFFSFDYNHPKSFRIVKTEIILLFPLHINQLAISNT